MRTMTLDGSGLTKLPMKVSVVIPNVNERRRLEETIARRLAENKAAAPHSREAIYGLIVDDLLRMPVWGGPGPRLGSDM